MPTKTITRKELAARIGISLWTLKRHERAWHLPACRMSAPEVPHTYSVAKVNRELLLRLVIEKPIS